MKITIASVGPVILLQMSVYNDLERGRFIVLVDRGTDYESLVTWHCDTATDGTIHAFNGHYFSNKDAALLDFHDRAQTAVRTSKAQASVEARKAGRI